ncbi:hypothetical protein BRADI_2g35350v3 [Brachypodium distachyon]|uniref:Uncharacterized protein n=1 Tax=Brachypodium distachyon TaxID=15368 RepID=A0A0Q3J3V5_BRADI|nr:hypothetical protein BRADI_2g35350v3 [Brachypodium distachyon]
MCSPLWLHFEPLLRRREEYRRSPPVVTLFHPEKCPVKQVLIQPNKKYREVKFTKGGRQYETKDTPSHCPRRSPKLQHKQYTKQPAPTKLQKAFSAKKKKRRRRIRRRKKWQKPTISDHILWAQHIYYTK